MNPAGTTIDLVCLFWGGAGVGGVLYVFFYLLPVLNKGTRALCGSRIHVRGRSVAHDRSGGMLAVGLSVILGRGLGLRSGGMTALAPFLRTGKGAGILSSVIMCKHGHSVIGRHGRGTPRGACAVLHHGRRRRRGMGCLMRVPFRT